MIAAHFSTGIGRHLEIHVVDLYTYVSCLCGSHRRIHTAHKNLLRSNDVFRAQSKRNRRIPVFEIFLIHLVEVIAGGND